MSNEEIGNLFITQQSFRNWPQITDMISSINRGESICKNPIFLNQCEDGEIEINDGHHRAMAMYLAGANLIDGEYQLIDGAPLRRRFGKIKDYKARS